MSDTESIPSPCTSPPQARRHYGESITNLGKASIMGEEGMEMGVGIKYLCEWDDEGGGGGCCYVLWYLDVSAILRALLCFGQHLNFMC